MNKPQEGGKMSKPSSCSDIVRNSIHVRRKLLKLSQLELAKRCGLAQSTIAQLETKRKDPSLSTLIKIAGALHCDVRDLFYETKMVMQVKP